MSSNHHSLLLLSHLVVLCSDANQISRLCNSSCRAPTSNITPLVNATTGEDIQNFPVTVAAIQTMNGMNHVSSFSAVYRCSGRLSAGSQPYFGGSGSTYGSIAVKRTRILVAVGVILQSMMG